MIIIRLIRSFSNFLTSSRLVRFFRLTAPAAMLGHLGAISLKNLTKRKEVRKGADQANGVVEMKRVAFNHILLKKPAFSTILSCAIRSKKSYVVSNIICSPYNKS